MASGRFYTVSFTAIAVTAAVDIFEITPADDKPVSIIGMMWGQTSDPGDAQAEQIAFRVVRGHTTSGSGGTATTPQLLRGTDTAASFTAETNNTTAASAGTTIDLHSDVMNLQAGYQIWLPEGCEWRASQANTTLVIRLAAAPTDSITTHGTLYVCEE